MSKMVESYNLKEKFDGSLTRLADHIENAIETDKVQVIHKQIKNDKIYFMLENVSEDNKVKLTFDFTGAMRGCGLIVEFEDVYAFTVDYDYFYMEPNRRIGYKQAHLHRFKGIHETY